MAIKNLFIGVLFVAFGSPAFAIVNIDKSALSNQVPMTLKDQEILFKAAAEVEAKLQPTPVLFLNTNASAQDAADDLIMIDDLIKMPNDTETWGCGRVECGGERF